MGIEVRVEGLEDVLEALEKMSEKELMDAAAKGFASRMRNSAAKRAVGGSLSLRSNGASSKKLSITQARITEGLPPVKRA